MKLLRCLFGLTLVCALTGMAKADPIDFHMVVVDPPAPPPSQGFNTVPIKSLTAPVLVQFSPCVAGQIPNVVDSYEGCASFENSTTTVITSLELEFTDTSALHGQPSSCSLDPGLSYAVNFFATNNCQLVGDEYILSFSDGSIPVGDLFTIAEDGVTPDCFPDGTMTIDPTPEPSSIWLMSTGALLLGAFFYSKRRHGLSSMGF